jgi:hypothetical protein
MQARTECRTPRSRSFPPPRSRRGPRPRGSGTSRALRRPRRSGCRGRTEGRSVRAGRPSGPERRRSAPPGRHPHIAPLCPGPGNRRRARTPAGRRKSAVG